MSVAERPRPAPVPRQAPTLALWVREHYADWWTGKRFLVLRRVDAL